MLAKKAAMRLTTDIAATARTECFWTWPAAFLIPYRSDKSEERTVAGFASPC
jgi:hypothetical protein